MVLSSTASAIILVSSNIFLTAIDCEWNDWIFGECSKSCGTGTRINNRTKAVEEANGGTCDGESTETEECNAEPCPGMLIV